MKKVFILSALVFITFLGNAQKGLVTKAQSLKEAGKLDEALQNINKAIDPSNDKADKTINWPNTWEVRGEVYQAIFQSKNAEFKKLADDPLTEAVNSYKKAIELDTRGRNSNSIKVKLTLLINDLTNQAVEAFNKNDYNMALLSFEQILDVQDIDLIAKDNPGVVDTVIIFNEGLAAYNGENYDKAIKYYEEAAKYGYNDAKTYSLIASSYQLNNDTLGALAALQRGFEKYPDDNVILTSMIQLYMDQDKTEEAMKYLKMAIEQDPENATFYFAQGALYEKLNDEENAIEAYMNAIEADKEFFNAYYNLGALYYNKGVKQIEYANTIPAANNKVYEEELSKSDIWFKKALPFMEECYNLRKDDNMTLESLKNLYYRVKDMDNYNKMLEKLGQ